MNPRVIAATIAVAFAASLFSLVAPPLLSLVPADTAHAQQQDEPMIDIEFSPEGTVTKGTKIDFTLKFSGLSSYDSNSGLKYGVNVVGHQLPRVVQCGSTGAFADPVGIGTISGGNATTTGTIPSTCSGGLLILVASLYDSNDDEIISTAKGFTVTGVQSWDLPGTQPTSPAGLWGEGVNVPTSNGSVGMTRLHVVDKVNQKVYVYHLPAYNDQYTPEDERDSLTFVETYDLASTTAPWGIVSSKMAGITWVSDDHSGTSSDRIFAYRKGNIEERVSNKEFNLHESNSAPRGIHYTSELYVADDDADKIFAYESRYGSGRDSGNDYELDSDNTHISGIWASGHTMWVADYDDDKLYAYNMHPNNDHIPEWDVIGINDDPAGIWSNYDRMYVVDSTEKTIYGYSLPRRKLSPHVISGRTYVEHPENSTENIERYSATDPVNQSISWSLFPSGDHQYFEIYDGYLSFKSPPNYEDPKDIDPTDNIYHLVLIASSGEYTHTYYPVRVEVTDVPWEQPYFPDPSTTRTIEENTTAGQNIGDPVVAEPRDSDVLVYSFGGTDAASFDFNTSTAQIITKAELNYEAKPSYSVTVSVRDNEDKDGTNPSTEIDDSIDVTIEVIDLDEGPVVDGPGYVDHPENELQVAEYTADDPNSRSTSWQPLTGDDAGKFTFSNGVLSFESAPNHEDAQDRDEDNYYEVTIAVSAGNDTGSQDVTVYVTDVNEAPTFSSGSVNRSVAENTAVGENVGDPVTASDVDDGDSLTYELGGDDAPAFSIDSSTGQIITYDPLDHETEDEYNVTVTASDQSNATSSIIVSISVDDANDQPAFPTTETGQRSVEENAANANVGAPVAATDQDGDTLTYELTGGATSTFSIDQRTGQLRTNGALDSDDQDTYSLTVSVRDNKDAQGAPDTAEDASIQVTITVTDVNEPPVLTGDTSPDFAENGSGTVATYDDGDPEQGSITWSLSGADAADLDVSGGVLTFNSPPNHEVQDTYNVIVQAFDGNSTGTLPVVVTVTDVNEKPTFPPTETEQRSVVENTGTGQDVGIPVAADDPDEDAILDYTLSGPDAASFDINSSNGQILTKDALDEDTKNTYDVTVEVHDGKADDGSVSTTTDASIPVTITVTGVNEPPVVSGTTTTEYAENDDHAVETYTATDPENDNITWSLAGTGSDVMDITPSGGELTFNDAPNYEAKNVYRVTVQASDGHSTTTHPVKIDITDVNEQAEFPGATTSRSVVENTLAGQNIGLPVSATDPDSGDTLTYILRGQDADLFGIATSTGQILTKSDLDADIGDTYYVYVDVHDGKDENGGPSTAYDDYIDVTITVENVNEVPVVSGTTTTSYVENDTGAVATYTADDPENDDITWSPSGTNANAFSISEDGVLSFVTPPDFEAKEEYSVTVKASDGKLTGTLEVTITITDVNEPPDVTGRTAITFVETATGPVETFKANDPEESDSDITWEVLGTNAGDFTITNGALNFASTPDYQIGQDNTYEITIKATDDEDLYDELEVTVIVTDENEPPEFSGATTSRDVSENTAPNQNVGSPVSATDPERDLLTYSISGSDSQFFDIATSTGQILTKSTDLDYESSKKSYTVTVRVTDNKNKQGNDDPTIDNTIDVTINVIDEDEGPEITSGATTTSWNENATGTVETYRASDPENATTTWTVHGPDAGDFGITEDGDLYIDTMPDYESKPFYQVRVQVSDGGNIAELDVTINIENVDEDGEVTLSPTSPQVGTPVNASLTDPDRLVSITSWAWHRSPDKNQNNWTLIGGATGSAYTPVDADEGNYLRATASYDDGHGTGKSAHGISDSQVPTTNSPPSFFPNVVREVNENTGPNQPIGDPVTAMNAETEDTLVYALGGTDAGSFDFSTSTGQLMTKDDLDFETKPSYTVTVSVSDGKNTNNGVDTSTDDTITVTVNVKNVNEAPELAGPETVDFNENATTEVASYTATDPEKDSISWSVSGTDPGAFDIATGTLSFKSPPDFETKPSYQVTVEATDGPNTDRLVVTVNINNLEEEGSLTLSSEQPQRDARLTATLSDPDGDISELTWTWEAGTSTVQTATSSSSTTNSYTPVDGDVGKSIRVTVSYTDVLGSGKSASVTSENQVRQPPVVHHAPTYQSQTTERSVPENSDTGENIGDPVTATDQNSEDVLNYKLGGQDAAPFDINTSSGQLKTKSDLDHEDKDIYTVTVTATDPSNLEATITVTITVTDVNESPKITGPRTVTYKENNSDAVANYTVTDPENGRVTVEPKGTDGAQFRIPGGQLFFNAHPDFEAPRDVGTDNSYNITLEASDGNSTTTLEVTVTVTDVNEPPQFPNGDTGVRSVTENTAAGQNVGAPVSASDPEKNALHYTLSGRDARYFDIDDSTGQILAKIELNYESRSSYSVRVSVRDSLNVDGNTDAVTDDTIDITINVIGENEAPVITGATSTNFAENGTRAVASYSGRDPEGSTVQWTLLGTDSAYFAITNSGVLSFDPAPDYEDPMDSDRNNVYHVTVQASDGNNINRLDMTVTVTNVEEAGTVELSSVQPQVDTALTATLDDPDDVVSAITWSWQRSRAGSRSSWTTIGTATSDSYTPALGDVGRYLRVTARYDDGYSNGKSASAISENTVRAVPQNNNPPRFLSQFTSRTVDENTGTGENIGDPVTATDDPTDNLTYTLEGTDAAMFRIVRSTGQLQTRMPLDYESRTGYSVSVTAADPSNATSSIRVNITVVNIDEPPVAVGDSARATEDGSAVTIDVLANDSDPEGMSLTLSAVTQPANGSAVVAGRNVEYTPNAGYYGSDAFTYTVSDGSLTSVGSVSVIVDADGDPTVQDAVIPIQFVPIDGGGARILLSDYFSDPDDGQPPYQATTSDAAIATVEVSDSYLSITPVGIGVATTTLTVSDTPGISQEFRVVVYRPVVARTPTETVHIVDPAVETTLTSTTTATTTSSLSVIFQAGARDQFFQAAIDAQSNNCGVEAPIGHQHVCVLVDLFDLGAQSIEESLNLPSTLHVDLDQTLYSAVQTAIASGEFQMWKGHGPTDVSWDQVPLCPDLVGQDECYSLIPNDDNVGGRITVFNIMGFSEFAAGLDQPAPPPTEPPTTTPPPDNSGGGGSGSGSGSGGSSSSSGSSSSGSSGRSSSSGYRSARNPQIDGQTFVSYQENGTDPVTQYTVEYPNEDDIVWSLLGYDRKTFEISNDGVLSFRHSPDYENPTGRDGNTYWLIVQATDDRRPSKYDITNVQVTVTQVNELGVLSGDTELSVTEDHTGAIAQYQVDDPENGVITWSLSGPDASVFDIDGQGNLVPADSLDFETQTSSAGDNIHVLTIMATDDGEPEASAQLDVAVTVSNVNEAPWVGDIPSVDLSTRHLPWMINLGEFFTDPDGDSLTYEVSGWVSVDVARASIEAGTLSIAPIGGGTVSFTVVGADPDGLRAVGTVAVSVTEPAPAPTPAPVPVKVTVPVPTSTPAPVAVVVPVPTPVAPVPMVAPVPSPTPVPLSPLSELRWRHQTQQPDAVSKVVVAFAIEPVDEPRADVMLPPVATPVPPQYVSPVDAVAAAHGQAPLSASLDQGGGLPTWLMVLLTLIAMVTAGYAVRMYVIHRL